MSHVVNKVPEVITQCQKKLVPWGRQGYHGAAKALERLTRSLEQQAELVERVIYQTGERLRGHHIKDKIYSLHEPLVACIRKGKRRKPDEYGCKVRLSIDPHGYVVEHQEYASNPADSELLEEACQQWEDACGEPPKELGADRGFHKDRAGPPWDRIERVAIPTKGKRPHPDAKKPWFKRLQKQRIKIEPIISHLKNDHRMNRSRYRGFEGDKINVCLAVIAWNTKKWGKHLATIAP